jgi:hypothetical protein
LAQLGKYFQLISIVPSTIVVIITYALIAGGAPADRPDWRSIGNGLRGINLASATALVVAIIVLGMTLHPFQFAVTQFLEGYWGPSAVGRMAMFSRARIHHSRWRHYQEGRVRSKQELESKAEQVRQVVGDSEENETVVCPRLLEQVEADLLEAAINFQEFDTAVKRYPLVTEEGYPFDIGEFMATRLGNTLRRYENLAGEPYGLDAPAIVPHLMKIAPPEQVAYVNDTRAELDLAVRFVLSWLLVAGTSFVLLWPYGPWLTVSIAAYGLAWLSYKAAVQAAEGYGHALLVLLDLNHSLLEDQLHLHHGEDIFNRARIISAVARRDADEE